MKDIMKDFFGRIVAGFILLLLIAIVPALYFAFNLFILWAAANVDVLGIKVMSGAAYVKYAMGMLLFLIPALFAGIVIDVLLLMPIRNETLKELADKTAGVLLFIAYIHWAVDSIDELHVSVEGTVALAVFYCFLIDTLFSDEFEQKVIEYRKKYRKWRRNRKKRKNARET
ncbi:hypothetical protein [Staphylospora marina]|uniref:hypothetical protein n=1 Tax=Staphylospora marina TaxID=2490858 RepID=UPI000F5BD8B1|nr:hypothetical protein [Staphylospora marina]